MSDSNSYNLRGIRISPQDQSDTIHYYVVIMEQPSNHPLDTSKITQEPIKKGDTSVTFNYDGTFHPIEEGSIPVTYLVGMITSQDLAQPDPTGNNLEVNFTDSHGTTIKGNPNKGKPPVVEFVDTDQSLTPTTVIMQSANCLENFFVAVLVKTVDPGLGIDGGYANHMTMSATGTTITANLNQDTDSTAVTAIGVFPSLLDQYENIIITNDDISTGPFNFNYISKF